MRGKSFKQLLLNFALISIVSTSSFAMEIYKGHVVKHKEWTTGNVKSYFKDSGPSQQFLKFKNRIFNNGDNYTSAFILSEVMPTHGTANSPVSINGSQLIFVANQTQETQEYNYTLSLCADTTEHTSLCSYYYDEIELEPGGYAISGEEPILQVQFDKPGLYSSEVVAQIRRDNSSIKDSGASIAIGTIDISAGSK